MRCNRIVRAIFDIVRERSLSIRKIEEDAGLGDNVIHSWRNRKEPLLGNALAALEAMGFELVIVPKGKTNVN